MHHQLVFFFFFWILCLRDISTVHKKSLDMLNVVFTHWSGPENWEIT